MINNLRSGSIFVSLWKLHSGGHGETKMLALAVRENVWEPLKLGLISGYTAEITWSCLLSLWINKTQREHVPFWRTRFQINLFLPLEAYCCRLWIIFCFIDSLKKTTKFRVVVLGPRLMTMVELHFAE